MAQDPSRPLWQIALAYGLRRFAAVEKEASLSRVYAGQHFRSDENAGERLGSAVADFVVDNFLTRVDRRDDY